MLPKMVLMMAMSGFMDDTAVTQANSADRPLELHAIETDIVQFTNMERIRRGLPPLEIDDGLITSARRHATWMTNARSLTHTSAPVAENIAVGQRNTSEVLRAWMNSSGHRANILNRSYTRMGAAAFITPNGTIYWCQQFLK